MKVKDMIDLGKVIEDYKSIMEEIGEKTPDELSTSELTLLRRVSTGSISSAKKSGRSNEEIINMDKFSKGASTGCGQQYGIDDTLMVRTIELARIFGTINIKQGWNDWAKSHHPDRGGDTEEFSRVKSLYESWVELAGKGI